MTDSQIQPVLGVADCVAKRGTCCPQQPEFDGCNRGLNPNPFLTDYPRPLFLNFLISFAMAGVRTENTNTLISHELILMVEPFMTCIDSGNNMAKMIDETTTNRNSIFIMISDE